jgi:hypothetical protein
MDLEPAMRAAQAHALVHQRPALAAESARQ